jgi:hypothetical protein
MENVRMKATDIRDKIMDWLGFTKLVDEKTGEITWKLQEGYTKFELIKDTILGIGLALAGWKISKALGLLDLKAGETILSKLKENVLSLAKIAGVTTIAIGLVTMLNGVKNDDPMAGAVAALELGLGTFLTTFEKYGFTKAGSAAVFTFAVSLTVSSAAYSLKHFEETAENMYGEFENLSVWQKFNVFMTGMGESLVLAFARALGYEGDTTSFFKDFGKAWNKFFDDAQKGYENWLNATGKAFDDFDSAMQAEYEKWLNDTATKLVETQSAWEQYFNDVKTGYENWKNDVAKKAGELWSKLETGWTNFKTNTKTTFTRLWEEDIAPWFTWEKWKGIANTALNALKTAFENFRLPDIKLPHFEVSYDLNAPSSDIWKKFGLQGKPNLSINWYGDGGLPDVGEIFVAREAGPELLGKIGNSNAVMNNNQIVEAVSTGVARAVSSVLGNRNSNQPIRIEVSGRELATIVRSEMNNLEEVYGY